MRYRLTRTTYRYKIRHEEDPGSTVHVVDSAKVNVVDEWTEPEESLESEVIHETAFHVYHRYYENTKEEESYDLQRFDSTSNQWRYIATLYPKPYKC